MFILMAQAWLPQSGSLLQEGGSNVLWELLPSPPVPAGREHPLPCSALLCRLAATFPWLLVAELQDGWLAWFGSRSFNPPFAALPLTALCKWTHAQHRIQSTY